jgi:O-antigen biosynthesis protein WbqP
MSVEEQPREGADDRCAKAYEGGAGNRGMSGRLNGLWIADRRFRVISFDTVKRGFDVSLALLLLLVFFPFLLIIALIIKASSKGPVLHWSERVGKENRIFQMPKFRSMRIDTPQLPTHLLPNPTSYLSPVGSFLRRTSLDEVPQLLSILEGKMSFVGPRPALFNQDDLVALRTERGVHKLLPGLTGLAQVNGRDELPIPIKVEFDYEYLRRRSFWLELQIIAATVSKALRGEGVRH